MRTGPTRHATISVRLSRDEERLVRRVARQRKSTVTEVVREAINRLAERDPPATLRPYDQIADLIGSVADLPTDLSERTGEHFAQIAREAARRR